MAGIPIQPHQGIGKVRPSGGLWGQLFNCLLHSGHPGLVWVHPHCSKAKHFVSLSTSSSQDEEEGNLTLEFLWVTPGPETGKERKV